jgi:hypothetical protein
MGCSEQNEPIYFDGRCPIDMSHIKATSTTLVSAKSYGDIPPVTDISNKPIYYDGSQPFSFMLPKN